MNVRVRKCAMYLRAWLRYPRASFTMASADSISLSELKALLKDSKDLLLVDVRSKGEVERGRIPGSIHIPVENVENDLVLDPDAFKDKFGVAKPSLDAPHLVFHCQMGKRGGVATEKARHLGFKFARNYTGGYKEWSDKEGQ